MTADRSPARNQPGPVVCPLFIRTIHIPDVKNISSTEKTGEMRSKSLLHLNMQLAFASAMLILVVVAAIFYRGMVVSRENERWGSHTHEDLESVQDLACGVDSIESDARVFSLTGKTSYSESYRAGLLQVTQDQARIRDLMVD